jgi:LPXTG-motif cell wall-anchored protein
MLAVSLRASLAAFANPDSDNDGTTSEVEDAAPNNGDGNNDGTPDAEQANVTSFVSPETGQYVTIVTPTGTTLSTVTAAAAPSEGSFTHYYDMVGFTVTGVTPGGSIELTILQQNPDSIDAAQLTARKYFPSTSSYQTIPDATISNQTISNQPVLSLAFSLTDGGDYDLDQTADGSITDPVSLATTSQDTLADTGQSATFTTILSLSTFVLASLLIRKRRQI